MAEKGKINVALRLDLTITAGEDDKEAAEALKRRYEECGFVLYEEGGLTGEVVYQLDRSILGGDFKICRRCGCGREDDVKSDICGTCADDLREEANAHL